MKEDILKLLRRLMDTDDGISEDNYNAVYDFFMEHYTQEDWVKFDRDVDATDGRFYIKLGNIKES